MTAAPTPVLSSGTVIDLDEEARPVELQRRQLLGQRAFQPLRRFKVLVVVVTRLLPENAIGDFTPRILLC